MAGEIVKLEPGPKLRHDAELWVSVGRSRSETHWVNKKMMWSRLIRKFQTPTRTPETFVDYMGLTKAEQDKIKDVGGFVGGTLRDGRRNGTSVTGRSMISFDLDTAPENFYEDFSMTALYASACYSTHKHQPKKPRLRLLIPLSRTVTAEEYEAVARMLAFEIGMDYFDPTTFQPYRLMFWPSVSDDGAFYSEYTDAPFLDPDTILKKYHNWHDVAEWPRAVGDKKDLQRQAKNQQDPTTKKGPVGAFCRAYDVPAAISEFLSDVYAPTSKDNRYTYTKGSTFGGVVVYGDGKFAYSNHATDPAGGMLCNAFDLVRIHKFGDEDEDAKPGTPAHNMPSYRAMVAFVQKDKKTLSLIDRERREEIDMDFGDDDSGQAEPATSQAEWKYPLERKPNSLEVVNSVRNCDLIFRQDSELQGIALNRLSGRIEILDGFRVPWKRKPGPWTDTDDAFLRTYLAKAYTEFKRNDVTDQLVILAEKHGFHPVKRYLETLPEWDGVPRAKTILIDYLGAEDSVYTREVTWKTLLAAVRRVYEPGVKFDTMLVISGDPGTGKSTLIGRLAGDWFSDSLTFEDMKDKTAAEKLQGYWILEIGEMKGMRKMDVESVKSFLSRREDIYRAAYARNTENHKRQCVIFGTVNDMNGYLKDLTGNRRFWPVDVSGVGVKKAWDMTEEERGQIWKEVWTSYTEFGDDSLILSPEAEAIAVMKQTAALESDDREGPVSNFLSMKLPENWNLMTTEERIDYIEDYDAGAASGVARDFVTIPEIWCECFRNRIDRLQRKDSFEIAGILKRLGWERLKSPKRTKNYGLQRAYLKPEKA